MKINSEKHFLNAMFLLILLMLTFICEAKKSNFKFDNGGQIVSTKKSFNYEHDYDHDHATSIIRRDNLDLVKSVIQKYELAPKRRRLRTEIFRRLFVG